MPRCPSCNSLLTRVQQDTIRLATCPGCFGTWIAHSALLRLLRAPAPQAVNPPAAPRGPDTPPPLPASADPSAPPADQPANSENPAEPSLQELAAIVLESDTQKTLRCPDCHVDLRKDRFHPMIPITIDRCPKCDYLWLDVGELPLLQRLYRELLTSNDPQVIARRNKVAAANLALDHRPKLVSDVTQTLSDAAYASHELTYFLRALTDF